MVGGSLIVVAFNKTWNTQFNHSIFLELLWTLLPIIALILLGFPSLKALYMSERFLSKNTLGLKVLGHQWYWEYRIPEFIINFNCYLSTRPLLYRFGETDLLVLPFSCLIRRLISSHDVLHSWCLPSLGFKIDACPGRLNYFIIRSSTPSSIIGQCSELCGAYHSWIPIQLEFTSVRLFTNYLKLTL